MTLTETDTDADTDTDIETDADTVTDRGNGYGNGYENGYERAILATMRVRMGIAMEESSKQREKEWLVREVGLAANLSDRDRIRILRDLLETLESIRRGKTAEELEREEEVLNALEREPGLRRYRALVERLE